jgi:peptidoglycan hydrolase CwlO-like protein
LEVKKDGEDENTWIAFGNLWSKVIELRHKVEEKKIMLTTLAKNLIGDCSKF